MTSLTVWLCIICYLPVVGDRQPVLPGGSLLLEGARERVADVSQPEGADRGSADGVGRGREDSVQDLVIVAAVAALEQQRPG